METASAEIVAARAVAVFAIERLVRDRTAPIVWSVVGLAAVLFIGSILSDGLGAAVLGVLAVVAGAAAATMFVIRAIVLRLVRRIAGGPAFARVRPVIERHMAEVEDARSVATLDPVGLIRLLWLARHPADLRAHVQQVAATVMRAIPMVVTDVRRELVSGKP